MRSLRAFGFVALIIGVALVFGAFAGASSLVYPQYAIYYWTGAAGITVLVSGLLGLAWQIE